MMKEDGRRFYTVPEAARLLEVSPATLWRWIATRRLPAYRVGPRRIRVRREDLEALIRPARSGEAVGMTDKEPGEIFAGYDPGRAREALRRSAGALAGVDRDELLRDIHVARRQASRGRPE
jgi:excisionase family DNA binding protein